MRSEIGLTGRGAIKELAGLVQPLRLLVALPGLLPRRRGPGRSVPVVVLPGRNQGDVSTLPLRAYLAQQGFTVHGWGLGRHERQARATVPEAVDRLAETWAVGGEPVALVGQSLGGYVAIEVARRRPDLVDQVITLGSPVFAALAPLPTERPITALWSPHDQVVPPSRAVVEDPEIDHVEITSTHFAMGLDPDVWRTVATRLALGAEVASPR